MCMPRCSTSASLIHVVAGVQGTDEFLGRPAVKGLLLPDSHDTGTVKGFRSRD